MTASCAERDDAEPTDSCEIGGFAFRQPLGGSERKRPVDLSDSTLLRCPSGIQKTVPNQDTRQTRRILNGDGCTSRIGDARGHSQGFIETAAFQYLEDNLAADKVRLTPQDLKRIDEVAPPGVAAGERYPAALMGSINL